MHAADWVELACAVSLWRPAYRASLIKLSRSSVSVDPNDRSQFGRLKNWWAARQEKREKKWSERDHALLILGFVLLVASSAIKIFLV
ncbi:MAG TPA: hypothetical protein VKC60_07775 [Opitutaceae bacterium]|nr:hypothetical protein [Opitutaceae bacterium]